MTSLVNDQTQPGAPMSPQGRSASCLVVLGTGGTISGKAGSARDNVGYSAGLVGVSDLLDGVPGLDALTGRGLRLEAEQLAQAGLNVAVLSLNLAFSLGILDISLNRFEPASALPSEASSSVSSAPTIEP